MSMDFMGAHRLLLAMKSDSKLKSLLKLDMQNTLRKQRYNIKYYVDCEDTIAKYITETCGMSDFTNDEVLTALGLFEVLSLPIQNGAKAFLPEVDCMKKSCVPNTYFHVDSTGTIFMKAS